MSESKKNIIFFTVLSLLIIFSISFTYYKIFIKEDFLITNEVTCDPNYEQKCFFEEKKVCDENDLNNCHNETRYFKKISKKAYNIEKCSGNDCEEVSCLQDEKDCEYIYCTSEDEYEEDGYKVSCVR